MARGVTAPAGQRRKRMTFDERRQEFIAAAVEFFAEEGFESSTRELARRLGVTQPLLYRYFPSKEDLIGEVYETVYVNRWRDDWDAMIADRSLPLRERLIDFYDSYTDVVFRRDWMRIFLFSGLKGVDINRRYLGRVRERILDPIVRECRHADGLDDLTPLPQEVEYAWVMHGGIYYYGVRKLIYEAGTLERKRFVIETSIDAFQAQIATLRDGTSPIRW
jgi:AcrR family transcriptional regulator